MMDLPSSGYVAFRCRNCLQITPAEGERCEHCGRELRKGRPSGLFNKLKRLLGVDLSSDIVTIDLEDNANFFSNQEIDLLLKLDQVTVLGIDDVPQREEMFVPSKRIKKPNKRN